MYIDKIDAFNANYESNEFYGMWHNIIKSYGSQFWYFFNLMVNT